MRLLKNQVILFVICFCVFAQCNTSQQPESIVAPESIYDFFKTDKIHPDSLVGSWKLVRTVIEYKTDPGRLLEGVDLGINYITEFTKDSIFQMEYPKYLKNASPYWIKDDTLFFNDESAVSGSLKTWFFGLKGDTLFVAANSSLENVTVYEHYIKTQTDPDKVHKLKTEIFDWTNLLRNWKFAEHFSYPQIDRSIKLPLDIPQNIDLRKSNQTNFSFKNDVLVYIDKKHAATFLLRYQERIINLDDSESLVLTLESPDSLKYVGIRYDSTNE